MKLLPAGFFQSSGAVVVAFFFLSLSTARAAKPATPAPVAPPKKPVVAKTVKPAPAKPAAPAAASGVARPDEFADIYPGGNSVVSTDLALTEEGAHKAEALATFARGLVAEDNAETERSLDAYKRALALDPGYTDLAVKVAYELAKRNDVAGGIQVLKDAAKAAPKDPRPLVYLSQLYAKHLKKPDFAFKFAEQAITVDPQQFSGYLALYELNVAAGQMKKAEEVVERAEKAKSQDPKFWAQLGDLATRLYLREDGSSEPAHIERMNALFRRAADLGHDDAAIQAKAGDYFVLSRQVKEAIPFYLAALGKDGSGDDPALSNLRDKLARAFLVTEDKDRAIEMLEAVIAEHPTRFETYELLGELYQQKGDNEKALMNFEQTLLLDGSSAENYLRLTKLYLDLNRADKAVDTMRQAHAKFPDVPKIGVTLAVALRIAKRHTEAMTAFAEVKADAEQNHADLLDASFYREYGAAAEQAGLIGRAAELLTESIRLDPANAAESRNYLGYMWVDHDMNLDEAGDLIRKALESEPDNGAYLDSLGWYYFKKGEYDRALKEITRAMENLKKEDAVICDHLGEIYQALGKSAEAMTYWQKSLALEANPKVKEKIENAKQQMTKTTAPKTPPVAPVLPEQK
jgi:tetratricopeptide (TPR) repeat protein